jgi:hypothetical protein
MLCMFVLCYGDYSCFCKKKRMVSFHLKKRYLILEFKIIYIALNSCRCVYVRVRWSIYFPYMVLKYLRIKAYNDNRSSQKLSEF